MTQAELKQYLNGFQSSKKIEDVFFYKTSKKVTIIVVYIMLNIDENSYFNEYDTTTAHKIQDIINFFDDEDRITIGASNSNEQATIRIEG